MKIFSLTRVAAYIAACLIFQQCIDSDEIAPSLEHNDDLVTHALSLTEDCNCTYVVPEKTHLIDGIALGLKPGDVICLNAATAYKNLLFRNIIGTADNPITIKNCGGQANLIATDLSFGLKTQYSRYLRITGGNTIGQYGIKITGGHIGMALGDLSTNLEVDHVEIQNSGFAGVMAKTDPTCDPATNRGNFIMKNVNLNYNYVHDTGGEGFYVGNSFFENGVNTECGVRYPHEIHYLRLFNNIVKNSGWDGIQVGCATVGAKIYGNIVENYGTMNTFNQRNGMQLGEGTGGVCYGNFIRKGPGHGMNVLGLGNNLVHDNVIVDAGDMGIFCDDRYVTGNGFLFINNTIVNPYNDGIRIYANEVPMNAIVNNVIINPGSYARYSYPRKPSDAFVYKYNDVNVDMRNNFFSTNASDAMFVDLATNNFHALIGSPLIDNGADVSPYLIQTDYYKKSRVKGIACDIGASEYQQ